MTYANQKRFTQRKLDRVSDGFTIIEVILFLALSALFLTVAFAGIRGRTANVQFTDSMRSLQSFLVSEQNKLMNGVNSSSTPPAGCGNVGDAAGESNDCILVGRVVRFGRTVDPSEVTVHVLYGTKPTSLDVSSKNDLELIEDSTPKDDGNTYSNTISWGTVFNNDSSPAKSVNLDDTEKFDSIGWLRSPGSTRIVPIAFNSTVGSLDGNYYRPLATESRIADQVQTRLCFTSSDGRVAAIYFGDGAGKASIELVFDDVECR